MWMGLVEDGHMQTLHVSIVHSCMDICSSTCVRDGHMQTLHVSTAHLCMDTCSATCVHVDTAMDTCNQRCMCPF